MIAGESMRSLGMKYAKLTFSFFFFSSLSMGSTLGNDRSKNKGRRKRKEGTVFVLLINFLHVFDNLLFVQETSFSSLFRIQISKTKFKLHFALIHLPPPFIHIFH